MTASDALRRVGAFLHSVLPAELTNLFLLAGSTFLFIAPNLRWWPAMPTISPGGPFNVDALDPSFLGKVRVWIGYVRLLALPIRVAGAAGYFVCFWPGRRPVRRLFLAVLLPACASVLAVLGVAFFLLPRQQGPVRSVLYPASGQLGHEFFRLVSSLGPGFHFAVAGLILVALFVWLLYRDRSVLPIGLPSLSRLDSSDATLENGQRQEMVFVWMMICLLPLVRIFESLAVMVAYLVRGSEPSMTLAIWMDRVGFPVLAFLLVLLAIGGERREVIKQCLRVPRITYVGLAAVVPAAIASAWPLLSYVYDRTRWAAYYYGQYGPPGLGSYFELPDAASLWLLIPVLVEEVAWRGYLQPRFVRRYGLVRGIFLLGIVWGAFHFSWDFSAFMSYSEVFLRLGMRLAGTVAYAYVLAWLTIRSNSILPAAIAHGVLNMFASAFLPIRTPGWVLVVLWALMGYLLFRYWPPQVVAENIETKTPSMPEPAS